MDECIAWSTVGKNDWMDELLSRLGRGNFDIRSRLKNRELAPDQQRVENLNLRCIKYYFFSVDHWLWPVLTSWASLAPKLKRALIPETSYQNCNINSWSNYTAILYFQLFLKGPIGPSDIKETRTGTQKASWPTFCYSLQILPRSPMTWFPTFWHICFRQPFPTGRINAKNCALIGKMHCW